MKFIKRYTKAFQYLLPSPFSIAILLTIISFLIALIFTSSSHPSTATYTLELLSYWQEGLWDPALMVFAMQMMLMLVLGHILALSPIVNRLIHSLLKYTDTTAKAAFFVTLFTVVVALFNWGLGLIFGAIFARKVGEKAKEKKRALNYGLIGAAGYSGLMVWHGGISGSSLTKIAESGHLKSMVEGSMQSATLSTIPDLIPFSATVFSNMNLVCMALLLVLLPSFMYFLGLKAKSKGLPEFDKNEPKEELRNPVGAERLDDSRLFSTVLGGLFLLMAIYVACAEPTSSAMGFITPNYINFCLLGLGILLHSNFSYFLKALEKAIGGAAGILIQFPLYFGIMAIMKESGLINHLSSFFVDISSPNSFPILTFFSAGLVNIFVPSGGGQWAIQGPIIIQASQELNLSLSKCIMALAYGDQLTNMLQPFWALPLLGITGLKAKEILPYTLLLMLLGLAIYLTVLLTF